MSSGIEPKHGKLLAEMIVPSSHWQLQPEKQDPFTSKEAAITYLNSHNEPLYIHVPYVQDDISGDRNNGARITVTSREDDVVFTINDINNGGETALHFSHLKNLDSSLRTLIESCCDKKIVAL
ncbi:hypothetical protein KUL152_10120 [Tenacibaculum sp. KUL152]|nr:hypothetical protein KUL152_10120 [Tenacibaculum sp. KUL152]